MHNAFGGRTVPRAKYQRQINDTFGINSLKHMSSACPDPSKSISKKMQRKAIADYGTTFWERARFYKSLSAMGMGQPQ
jgi:hypothetical protein